MTDGLAPDGKALTIVPIGSPGGGTATGGGVVTRGGQGRYQRWRRLTTLNDQWGVRGAYTNIDAGGLGIDAYRLGATYNINDTYTVYAGLTQADLGGTTIDGFNIGLSMDFGGKPTSYETTADRLLGVIENAGAFNF